LKTYLYPSEEDHEWAGAVLQRLGNRPVILMARNLNKSYVGKKTWPDERWSAVRDALTKEYSVVDVGTYESRSEGAGIDNYVNLTRRSTIHQTAALMMRSRLLISPLGGLVHLASFCELATLVIVGGTEPFGASQYRNAEGIIRRPACSDCWGVTCRVDHQCIRDISVEEVLNRTYSLLRERTV
jgi:heptosyltransferase-2